MIRAKANTEQAIKGQIGQPAACMMDSKSGLPGKKALSDYGLRVLPADPTSAWPLSQRGAQAATHSCCA